MRVYLVMLIFLTILSLIAEIDYNKEHNHKENYFKFGEYKLIYIFIIFLSLFIISAIRWKVGTDYNQYEQIFNYNKDYILVNVLEKFPEYISFGINFIFMKLFDNAQFIFAIYSFLTIFLFIKAFKKYSANFGLTIYLYITAMIYFGSFNGIIQWTAASVLFLNFNYIIERKFSKYLIVVLIATMIHSTALIAIPIYFIVNRKYYSFNNLFLIIIAISIYLFFYNFIDVLFTILKNSSYGHYADWFNQSGREANPLRFLVALCPLILANACYKPLKNKYKYIDIFMNFSLLNVLIIFIGLKNYIFFRFAMYTEVYNILLIPLVISILDKKVARVLVYIIGISYLIYMVSLLPYDSNLLPYRTIFQR